VAQLTGARGDVSLETGARAIVIGVMANTIAKGGIVLITGSRELRRAIFPGLVLILTAGIGVAFFV
jgi:uncharacterized membrane protein (DUF4010 family)